jgi:hypothetical protein
MSPYQLSGHRFGVGVKLNFLITLRLQSLFHLLLIGIAHSIVHFEVEVSSQHTLKSRGGHLGKLVNMVRKHGALK